MKGTKLEIFQFATLKVGGPISEQDLAPESGAGTLTSHMSLESAAPAERRKVSWHAEWVPDGFTMASWDFRRTPSSLKSVDTLMYSDGLAAFSVFIEDMPESGASALVSRSGATVAVSEVVTGGPEDAVHHLVTVVGEIPTATAKRIAQSIRYIAQ
jgi:sigma-E factor negative regulatory protein RseB